MTRAQGRIYEGQLTAMESYAAGGLSTEEFADAFWSAHNREVGPGKRASLDLDDILIPVTDLLMGYEDDVPPVSPEEIMRGVQLALRRYATLLGP